MSIGEVAPVVWVLTGLFAVRVAGQALVALRAPVWLPAMADWNLTPYRLLLPTQFALLGVMVWLDVSFSTAAGSATGRSEKLGWVLIAFSAVYAGGMAARYVVRMTRTPSARWFGGTIPIVFHVTLALYLFTLGSFYAGN